MRPYQKRVIDWVNKTFGHQLSATRKMGYRFMEEAVELVEALGMTREDVHRVVDYVFDRKSPGEPFQELGGVMVTLAVVAETNGLNMMVAAEMELSRCLKNSDKIAAKDKKKPDFVKG